MNNIKIVKCLAPALLLLLLSGMTWASTEEVQRMIDSERIDLYLKDADMLKVFDIFKSLLGVEVQLRCTEERKITITFSNLTMRTALNAICESAGLRWSLIDSNPPSLRIECDEKPKAIKEKELQPLSENKTVAVKNKVAINLPKAADRMDIVISLNLKDAQLEKVLQMAAKMLTAQVILDSKLGDKTVSLDIKNTTMREFLDILCKQVGAKWHFQEGDSPLLIVDPAN